MKHNCDKLFQQSFQYATFSFSKNFIFSHFGHVGYFPLAFDIILPTIVYAKHIPTNSQKYRQYLYSTNTIRASLFPTKHKYLQFYIP